MKRIIPFFTLLLLLGTAGCKKSFFDINENPNDPTESSITPNLILPSTLTDIADRMATEYDFAAHWVGYWARSGTYGPSNPLENFDLTSSYQARQWINLANSTGWYNTLKDIDAMEKKANESGQTFYEGIAKILKSIGFMYLVDLYNNVPYSKAFDISETILPEYDKGQDIYNSLLAELDAANHLIADAVESENVGLAEADIMFGGDKDMWRKFSNTWRLKLLIHQSELFGGNAPTAEIAKITADGSGFLMSEETAEVQPGYTVDNLKQNPFYDTYKRKYNNAVADDFNRANNFILNKFRNNNDIRYQYVFSKAATPLNGNEYFGYDFGLVDTDPNNPKAANSSDVAGPGLAKGPTAPQWILTSVESLFLQAEAIARGWLPGDAQQAYNDAVTESFIWLGVANAEDEAEDYLTQGAAISDWASAPNKVNLIVTQKYLALIGINNMEAYTDYRRLGIPSDLPPSLSPSLNGRHVPNRLLYPQNEYSYNAANVNAQGTIDAQTSKIFWDVN